MAILFRQHNEHRIVFNRLITLGLYNIFGQLDFRHLMLIGNLGLIGLALLFYKSFKFEKNKLLFFLPAVFLLFQFSLFRIAFWGVASVEYIWVLLFAYLSLYFLFSERKNMALAIIFATCATFTFGNGIFVFFVAFLGLSYLRRKKDLLIWFVAALFNVFVYFFNYFKPDETPNIINSILNPLPTLHYFFLSITKSIIQPYIYLLGVFLLFFFLILTLKRYYEQNLVIYSFFVYLFTNAIVLAITRSGGEFFHNLPHTYTLYSVVFFVLLHLALMEFFSRWRLFSYLKFFKKFDFLSYVFFPTLLIFSIILYYFSYTVHIGHIQENTINQISRIVDERTLELPDWWFDALKKSKVQAAIDKGVYVVPDISVLNQRTWSPVYPWF